MMPIKGGTAEVRHNFFCGLLVLSRIGLRLSMFIGIVALWSGYKCIVSFWPRVTLWFLFYNEWSFNMAIRVGVVGAAGKMGREILKAVINDKDLELICAIGTAADPDEVVVEGQTITICKELQLALNNYDIDVVIDFTNAQAFRINAPVVLAHGVHLLSGTTGLQHDELEQFGKLAEEQGKCFFYASNFAIGAVLMMRFAEEAAKFMPEVEIIEFHHDQKKDAPSGTAISTLNRIAKVREAHYQGLEGEVETIPSSRGGNVEGMRVHSVRMPGYNAHQEVIFGGLGQTLIIRHDSINRESFMPGITFACKQVEKYQGFVENLDTLMF